MGSDDGGKSASASSIVTPSASASATGKPDFTTPSASPATTGVQPVDVQGDLLVVRREVGRWWVWRVTPATGAEERVAALPFQPAAAVASPDHRWSRSGDLAASTSEGATDAVFVAPDGDPSAFVALCAGSLRVWLQ